MTNKEFYGDKLLAVALSGNCQTLYRMLHGKHCVGLSCRDCEFGITEDSNYENVLQWLNAEHEEPPLLENGDGLKPGDWIMVRNNKDNEWEKFSFVCYHNDAFWTLYDDGDWFHIGSKLRPWVQARLPMEGE